MDTESPPDGGRRHPAPLRGAASHITTQPLTSDNADNTSPLVEVPSSFGLSPAALRHEIRRCRAAGWRRWELRVRFVDPSTVDWWAVG